MTYVDTRTATARMLASRGQAVTIAGAGAGTYDTATGAVTGGAAYNKTVNAVVLPLSPYRQERDTNVQAGDEQLLISAIDTSGNEIAKPPLNATVTLAGGATYKLIAVDPLHPDGTDLLFDCVIRGDA